MECFRSLARIAAYAAERGVFASGYACVIDDVLPRRLEPPLRGRSDDELDAAVDAIAVASRDLLFQPIRDVPAIHD